MISMAGDCFITRDAYLAYILNFNPGIYDEFIYPVLHLESLRFCLLPWLVSSLIGILCDHNTNERFS